MPLEFAVVLISTIGTAVWTVLTWTQQEDKERVAEQDQLDALYINPFLLATEELQSLLYRLLAGGEIEFLKSGVSHGGDNEGEITYHEALEVVYVIVKYFGWSLYFYRYGSYTQDKTAIQLTRNISEMFADREIFGNDAFRFTATKQRSLGQITVKRLMGSNAPYAEFNAIPLYQFDEEIMQSQNQNGHLYQDVCNIVSAIRKAQSTEDLEGRKRLIAVQNELVNLSNYIESKEGFTVSKENRKKVKLVGNDITIEEVPLLLETDNYFTKWLPLAATKYLPGSSSPVETVKPVDNKAEIVHKTNGRIRLKVPQLFGNEIYAQELQSLIQPITGVKSIQVNKGAASVIIYYDNQLPETEFEKIILEKINGV